jgi:hypothetical protein
MIRMFRSLAVLPFLLLPACAEVQSFSATAIDQRRTMNDMQARLTMAATCDIALGAYFRELSDVERQYAGLVCGGVFPQFPLPAPAAPAR